MKGKMKITDIHISKTFECFVELNGESYSFWWKRTLGKPDEFSIVQTRGGVVVLPTNPIYNEIVGWITNTYEI